MKEFDKINMIYGLIATVGVALFGKYWYLFAGFLAMNVIDYFTGWRKARYLKTESSAVGARGVLKKVGYWVVIGIAFYISFAFVEMGKLFDTNLEFLFLFGWFTLATYLINEIRSILENLIALKVNVPDFFIKGLEVAQVLIEKKLTLPDIDVEEEKLDAQEDEEVDA